MSKPIYLVAATALAMFTMPLTAQDLSVEPAQKPATQVDIAGFLALSAEVARYRQARLIEREDFFALAAKEGVLLLDTRSAADFAAGHVEGAINLPFSEFTDEKLREVIGEDQQRIILIYCNNNFSDDTPPIMVKRRQLALNIPTFINLYGYGYKNIWELDGVIAVKDVAWISAADQLSGT